MVLPVHSQAMRTTSRCSWPNQSPSAPGAGPLGIVALILLALVTFLGGAYVDWRFCIVRIVLAIGVILVAMIDDAALGIFLVGAVALAALYGLRHFSFRQAVEG